VYARLTTTLLAPDEEDAASEVFERILPTVREVAGFRGMVVLSELNGRRIVALSLWEDAEALRAGTQVMDGLRRAETAFRNTLGQDTSEYRVAGLSLD
jgi:heme-degrading monooxygenase HmoA